MDKPEIPDNEAERLAELHQLNILDTPIEKPFEAITSIAKQLYNVPIVAISLVDENRQWFKSVQGLDVSETERNVSFCGHAILQDEILHIPDAAADSRFADNPLVVDEPHIRFYAGCPIVSQSGYKLGTLCIIDRAPRVFSPAQLNGLKQLATLAELAISTTSGASRVHSMMDQMQVLDRESKLDFLTRIWNRRAGEEILTQLSSKPASEKACFGLGIIDIDEFKAINDCFGHSGGDACLKAVTSRMLATLREGDILVRWAGDEFLVICDVAERSLLNEVFQRIVEAVRNEPVAFDGQSINTTISVGASLFNAAQHASWQSVFDAADQALYESKAQGRNRASFKEALPQPANAD